MKNYFRRVNYKVIAVGPYLHNARAEFEDLFLFLVRL